MRARPTPLWQLLTSSLVLALAGCASAPEVRFDFDRGADFSHYKTFGFFNPLGTDRSGYQTVISQHLKAATQRELEARGMRLDNSAPELLVNFNASINEKVYVSSFPVMGVGAGWGRGYYGYRAGLYSGWGWPMYADQTMVTQYQEGMLNIDVVDAARKQMVWVGVVTNTLTQKELDNVPAAIGTAVAAAFAKYPVAPVAVPTPMPK